MSRSPVPSTAKPISTLSVTQARAIGGSLTVPGDKSLSHRAVIFAGLADGETHITGFLPGEDCLCTLQAMQSLGAKVEKISETEMYIIGTAGKLAASPEPIDCGNSGTAMRLLSGVLAAQSFSSKLFGDASLSGRPMKRIVDPLTQMGAKIKGQGAKHTAPLEIEGGSLQGITYDMPIASAQLKSCLLLAGLFAQGTTAVVETTPSRDHTERLLAHFHAAPVIEEEFKGKGKDKAKDKNFRRVIRIRGGSRLHAENFNVPGDISSAAFWIAAAAAWPEAELTITNLGLNPTRTGILGVLVRMGAFINESITSPQTEPAGLLHIRGNRLRGTKIHGAEIPNVIDELPILSVVGALSEGDTEIRDAHELRVKETDRIAAMAENLRAFGVAVTEHADGMTIHGGGLEGIEKIKGARVRSFGDHRIAMASAILGLFAKGETIIEDTDCIATSYPTFRQDMQKIVTFGEAGIASISGIATLFAGSSTRA